MKTSRLDSIRRDAKRPLWGLAACIVALSTACGGGVNHDLGAVSMELTSTSPSGVEYRLRNALISTTSTDGFADLHLTEDDMSQFEVTFDVPAGDYTVELLEGWWVEYAAPGQPFTGIGVYAELVSPNPMPITVISGGDTSVPFQVQVGTDEIDFGPGSLTVGFEVTELGSFDEFAQFFCQSNCGSLSSWPQEVDSSDCRAGVFEILSSCADAEGLARNSLAPCVDASLTCGGLESCVNDKISVCNFVVDFTPGYDDEYDYDDEYYDDYGDDYGDDFG